MYTNIRNSRATFLLGALILPCLAACSNEPISQEALESERGYADVAGVRLEVGRRAPDFTLPDAQGKAHTLSSWRGASNVMLLFYRGHWCPFCTAHLEDIQNLFPALAEYDTQLLAISPDEAAASQTLAKRFEQPYLFLSDSDLEVTDLYGIRRNERLPHPAVVLLDKQGVVRWFYVGESYKKRPSSSQLKTVLQRLFPPRIGRLEPR